MSIISNLFSREIEMYKIIHRNIEYNYTSSDKKVLFLNKVYNPETIRRSDILSSNDNSLVLNVNTVINNSVAKLFRTSSPSSIRITIFKASRDNLSNYRQVFNGVIKSCEISNNEATFRCQNFGSLLSRDISAVSYQIPCSNKVYDKRCSLISSEYSFITKIKNINQNGINIELYSSNDSIDQYYRNGVAILDDGQSRTIIDQIGNDIILQSPFEKINKEQNLTIIAGCDYSSNTCKNKFNNFENYRGFEYIPNRDPLKSGI